MYVALFLHLYQPPTQFAKVLESISNASYRRLLNSICQHPSAKVTLNVSASLTEQLAARTDLRRLIADFADLVKRGQMELVGSAAYHPLLTEISLDEIKRQILLNDAINRQYFGSVYQPRGFFPPEMAVNRQVLDVVSELGFKWVIVDGSAIAPSASATLAQGPTAPSGRSPRTLTYADASGAVGVFVRHTDLSVKVAFSQIRTVSDLMSEIKNYQLSTTNYPLVLAMDGETFGHHRPEQFEFLEELFSSPEVKLVTLSELQAQYPSPPEITIKESSWGPWEGWKNPRNPIHQLQWQLTDLAIRSVNSSKCKSQMSKLKSQNYMLNVKSQDIYPLTLSDQSKLTLEQRQWLKARELLDRSLHSDQFWWASAKPCWHYQMVKRGAKMLADVVLAVPDAAAADKRQARELYDKIIGTGLSLYGDCVIK